MKIAAEATDLRPRIGRRRSFRNPWSRSMPLVRYRPVRCRTPGTAAASAGGYGCLVGNDPTWRGAAASDRLLEERACGNQVACGRHIGVHDMSVAVDRAIDVVPAPADARIGL